MGMQNFYDLQAWQEARKLASLIYIETESFPKTEIFGLTNQMRRASISVAANIAEGFGRLSVKEKLNFYNQSNGSLTELRSHCMLANDIGYLSNEKATQLTGSIILNQKVLGGLVRSTRLRLQTKKTR